MLTENEEVITIEIKTFFGINRSEKFKLYNEIIDALWECHYHQVCVELIDRYNTGQELNFDDQYFIKDSELSVPSRSQSYDLSDIVIAKRFEFLAVTSKSKPEQFTNISYPKVWNASMLELILDSILDLDS